VHHAENQLPPGLTSRWSDFVPRQAKQPGAVLTRCTKICNLQWDLCYGH